MTAAGTSPPSKRSASGPTDRLVPVLLAREDRDFDPTVVPLARFCLVGGHGLGLAQTLRTDLPRGHPTT